MLKLSSLPKNTIVQCGVAAIISVFLVSWIRIRPLGLFFLATFGFWLYKTRCNLRIVPPPEFQRKIMQISEKMQDIRREQPTMFCLISAGCLSALAVVGHLLSGSTVVLTGLVLAAIISTKYNFKIIKIDHKDFSWADRINHDPEYDDEFLPEVDERNRFVLERAGDLASISSPTDDCINADDEEKSDDIPSELLIPDPIPEIHEISSDEDDNELIPIVRSNNDNDDTTMESMSASSAAKNYQNQNLQNDGIEFKKGHFKRDSSLSTSSSSSEESLSKGLKFPDHTAVDGPALQRLQSEPPNQAAAASDLIALAVKTHLSNSSKLLPNLVSGLVQWRMSNNSDGGGGGDNADASQSKALATTTAAASDRNAPAQRRIVTALDSSDESDFEILENEDFK